MSPRRSRAALVVERQWLHAVSLTVLLVAATVAAEFEGARAGHLWGIAAPVWLWMALATAIVHQVYVWVCWRMQLHESLLTRTLGRHAFVAYATVFSVLGIARVVGVALVAISNRGTVPLDAAALRGLAVIVTIPAAYALYSVHRYFGFRRAFGIDHFEDRYRELPFVRKGIFRYTRNGMYVFGFLVLWAIALWFGSWAALIAAAFNHLYIWVHYHSTELPDIRRIYGEGDSS